LCLVSGRLVSSRLLGGQLLSDQDALLQSCCLLLVFLQKLIDIGHNAAFILVFPACLWSTHHWLSKAGMAAVLTDDTSSQVCDIWASQRCATSSIVKHTCAPASWHQPPGHHNAPTSYMQVLFQQGMWPIKQFRLQTVCFVSADKYAAERRQQYFVC